jgi:hypothetical protein
VAKAVNQTIAWIVAFFLSAIVFAALLGLVFMVGPKRSHAGDEQGDSHSASNHDSTDQAAGHDETKHEGHEAAPAKDGDHVAAPARDKGHEAETTKSGSHESQPSAPATSQTHAPEKRGAHEAEEEISADSFKKPQK